MASPTGDKQRRLVLTVYRSLMRWCKEFDPKVPLDEFIPPMRGQIIDNVAVFRQVLRETFRDNDDDAAFPERIQYGIGGLRQLNLAREDIQAYSRQWQKSISKMDQSRLVTPTEAIAEFEERKWVQEQLDKVTWLPKLEDSPAKALNVDPATKFPLFPLRGAMFHPDTIPMAATPTLNVTEPLPLPLFSPQQDVPVPGMEVPLQIFEPRYRQLYSDLVKEHSLMSSRQIVVPFAHPFIAGQFANHGLIHQLTHLREIADETNGRVQYIADHVVTQPCFIKHILNPQVWENQETYLRIQGNLVDESVYDDDNVYEPLKTVLQSWKEDSSHPLAIKSLVALDNNSIWNLVHTWNSHFRQELLQLQLGVYTQVKRQVGLDSGGNLGGVIFVNDDKKNPGYTPEQVAEAQKPHRRRLLQLMLDTSLLVPTLLGLDGPGKCQHLMDMVTRERHFVKTNSLI